MPRNRRITPTRSPPDEAARLRTLRSYGVLDTPAEAAFDALTALAASVVGVPIALVSLVDEDRGWFKSRHGTEASQTPREASFCGHVVATGVPLIVPDATRDPRFADNAMVTGAPGIRLYAGAPLRTADGLVLGSLCAIGQSPGEVTAEQQRMLTLLAAQVVNQLERRRGLGLLRASQDHLRTDRREAKRAAARLLESEARSGAIIDSAEERIRSLVNVVEQTADGVCMTDAQGRIEYVNRAFEELTGWSSADAVGETPRILKSGVHDETFYRDLWHTLMRGEVFRGTIVNARKDGTTFHAAQTITPIRGAAGGTTHFVSLMKDETARRLALHQEAELELAAKIQRRLYPRRSLTLAGVEIGGFVLSASATCGDYYDWVRIGEASAGAVVGDVTGHGFGPALIMAETRAYLRSLTPLGLPPHEVLGRLDHVLKQDLDDGQFVTMLLVHLDLAARRLTYANAGHPAGWVLDASGAPKASLETRGPPLGLWWDATYVESESIALDEGDLIVLLSDGVTECRDATERFLEDGPVLDVIRALAREPVPVILDRIREMLTAFTGGVPMDDDATMVVCRVLGDDAASHN